MWSVKFMEGVTKDCAEKCPEDGEDDKGIGTIKYIPHHEIYHPKKTGKYLSFLTVVLVMLEPPRTRLCYRPDLTNNLVGVLCRFRQETVAFSCDVQSMYHQFYVNEVDRNLLRFLWWEGANLQARPLQYRMKVHALCAICTVPQVIPIVDRKWSREK